MAETRTALPEFNTTVQAPYLSSNILGNALNTAAGAFPAAANPTQSATYNPATFSGATATQAGAQGYNATNLPPAYNYSSADTTGQGYTADKANLANWNVGNNQTVQGQLQGILASNSPLLQQARTSALQQMNQRGLLNSSMAIGAGYDAMVKNALPVAQADAAMFGRAGEFNANAANNMAQFNAGQVNAASQFSANAANNAANLNAQLQSNAAAANAQAQNTFLLNNQQAQNRASEFGAQAANQASSQNAQLGTQVALDNASRQTQLSLANAQNAQQNSQFNAQQANAMNEANAGRQQQAQLANAEAANKLVQQQYDAAFKAALATADNQTKLALQSIDATTRKDLVGIEAQYKQLMQTSASASELYQQVTKNITDMYNNPDLTEEALAAGIQRQISQLQAGMGILDSLNANVAGLQQLVGG